MFSFSPFDSADLPFLRGLDQIAGPLTMTISLLFTEMLVQLLNNTLLQFGIINITGNLAVQLLAMFRFGHTITWTQFVMQ